LTRIAIATLGCKTNACESAIIIDQFQDCELVPFSVAADVYIINTCTVTNRTDYKSRNLIRKALAYKAQDPKVKVVVTGCYAQRHAGEVSDLGEVDLIVDNQAKVDIASLLQSGNYEFGDIMQAEEFHSHPLRRMVEHSRAFQKIQDGCDFYCTYCAVPYARGHNRSAAFEDVLAQARLFVENGYREIVLGGVNLGLYQQGGRGLAEVVEALERIEGLELIRLSSLEPQLITTGLLNCLRNSAKFCPHFHIPLQSGSDSVLQRMGRRYDTTFFTTLITAILERFPTAAIGLDVICGFPGETEQEFVQTQDLISGLPVAYLHVFSFSKRPGTPAADMPDQIPPAVRNQRVQTLIGLGERKRRLYSAKLIHEAVPLRGICESVSEGWGTFLSDHYLRCYSKACTQPGGLCRLIPQRIWKYGISD